MACWWYLILVLIDLIQAQNPFGGGFLTDPFLELNGGVTTPVEQKSSKSDSSCVSNGALAGSIIGTLLLSAFIAFLTWMIYLRQKLQELHSYENHGGKYRRTSLQHHCIVPSLSHRKQHINNDISDYKSNQFPLDVTDNKFGTFPFRQSQTPSVNGHYNHTDWLNRIPSSFRSVTMDRDVQTVDIELLNPTFCGLNFSITGNMRAGIFVKDILDKGTADKDIKLNSSDQLRIGDRIIGLTVCFESIVYEDALTILSYASPYPVILRVQRPINSTKINIVTEKQPATAITTTKVKWRDDFEHYDNDTSHNHSLVQPDSTMTLITDTKSVPLTNKQPSSLRKPYSKKTSSTTKGNKLKTISTSIKGKHRNKTPTQMILASTGLTAEPIDKLSISPIATNKTTMKSITNVVMSYLHHRGANGRHVTDVTNNAAGTPMPYYDSPYDYYGAQISQSHLNKNNNNSTSTESLTAVTSIYNIKLSSPKPNLISRRCERRLSSPAVIIPITIKKSDNKDILLNHIDTCV